MDGISLATLGDDDNASRERRAKQRQSPKRSEGDNSSCVWDCNSRSDIIPLWDASRAWALSSCTTMRCCSDSELIISRFIQTLNSPSPKSALWIWGKDGMGVTTLP